MKRKYFLHRQNEPMKSDTVVYVVWCGESVREQTQLTKLVAWAFASHATLMTWSEDIDFYLQIEAERLFSGRGLLDFGFIRTELSVREALTLAENDAWVKYESGLATPKAFFQTILSIDPVRVQSSKNKITPSRVLSSERKYLSQTERKDKHIIRFV